MVAELAGQVADDAAAVPADDEVASVVHEVDLLLSDFFALLPELPAPVAVAVCGAGARWLGEGARLSVAGGGSDRPGVSSVEMMAESIAAAL